MTVPTAQWERSVSNKKGYENLEPIEYLLILIHAAKVQQFAEICK